MPRSRAIERRVDVVDRPVGAALEGAVQRGDGEQARVVVGEAAVRGEHDLVGLPSGELHREAAELRRERDVRAERLEVLRADHRDVDRVRHEAALERRDDLLGDDHAGAILRLVGRRREVRRRRRRCRARAAGPSTAPREKTSSAAPATLPDCERRRAARPRRRARRARRSRAARRRASPRTPRR